LHADHIEVSVDADGGQTKYLLNNKIYVFLTPLPENKKNFITLL
jgi:hypothetical protein